MAFALETKRLSLRLRGPEDAVCNLELRGEHEGGTTVTLAEEREHLIEQQREAHWSPGEQLMFPAPRLLGCVLGRISGGDLRVDLVWVGRPVPDGSADEPQRDAGVVGD